MSRNVRFVQVLTCCAALAVSLAGCASEQSHMSQLGPSASHLGMSASMAASVVTNKMQTGSIQQRGAVVGFYMPTPETAADAELRKAAKKTYAGNVLAAIALERVTGLKPDPARLAVTN